MTVVVWLCDTLYYIMFFTTSVIQTTVNYYLNAFLNVAVLAAHRMLFFRKSHIDKDDKLIPFSCQK